MKDDVKLFRSYTDDANFERLEVVTRVYRFYTNAENFEAVEACDMGDGGKWLQWIARGTGSLFQPRGEIVDGRIIVRAVPIMTVARAGGEHCYVVQGGKGLPVEFES